ncbi:MAG: hypothetical protein DRI89_06315 [Bacteroidetes bacterium]|nr:MAG: hypothetical protein DRI89_06315 [Bacteroidota bacterium]
MTKKNTKAQSGQDNKLFDDLINKAELKQLVYKNTLETFKLFKNTTTDMVADYQRYCETKKIKNAVPFESKTISDFQIELKFAGDLLLFNMHSNIFEFPRNHAIMRTSYVKDDKSRSYCGVINIYNFLCDSFKYNRINDSGYLIGRIFINKDKHYFIEGKRELGFLFNNFGKHILDADKTQSIVEAAISYTINFDLLTPPYEQVKVVSVNEMKNALDAISLKTGKRLGFKFQADQGGE